MKQTGRKIRAFLKADLVASLLVLGLASLTSTAIAQSPSTFTATGNMITRRQGHTATLLLDGRVLIAGGAANFPYPGGGSVVASAELYDPVSGTFTVTGDMTTPRTGHTATLLPDGRVLITGGGGGNGPPPSAELYDPASGIFTATGNMIMLHQDWQTATLLGNGKVLVAGGNERGVATAELYDPATGTFTATGADLDTDSFDGETTGATATLLPDGRVLIAGHNPAQLYDSVTATFSLTGAMTYPTHDAATLLTNGTVLLAGPYNDFFGEYSNAEVYDPATGTFTSTGGAIVLHAALTATLLPDGTALIAGGYACTTYYCDIWESFASAELYDPATGTFTATGNMNTVRSGHAATVLSDGEVLITGGALYGGSGIFVGNTASAELYHPAVLAHAPVLFSLSGDGQGQGAILHASTPQVASSSNPAVVGEALEIYLTGLGDGSSVIPPQVAIGGRMAEVLYFGKAPGLTGVNQVNVRVPSGVAPGPAVSVRLTYLGRPSNEVTIGVQ